MKSIGTVQIEQHEAKQIAGDRKSKLGKKFLEELEASEERIWKRGEVIVEERSYDRSIYLLKDGEVDLMQERKEGVRRIRRIHRGELFGLSACPGGGFHFASVVAASTSATVKFKCTDVKKLLAKDKTLAEEFALRCHREKLEVHLHKLGWFPDTARLLEDGLEDGMDLLEFKKNEEIDLGANNHVFILSGEVVVKWEEGQREKSALMRKGDFWWKELYGLEEASLIANTLVMAVRINTPTMNKLFYGQDSFKRHLRWRVAELRDNIERVRTSFIENKRVNFLINNGVTYAEAAPVIDLSKCIRCRSCEEACRRRHGVKRIDIDATVKLEIHSFPRACHKCEMPTCIPKCVRGAMSRDGSGEVIIDSGICIGCGACAKGCPFGAIEVVPVEVLGIKDSVTPEGGREEVDGKAGRKVPKIASKCDRCFGYSDQACVRECPTGALSRILPLNLRIK